MKQQSAIARIHARGRFSGKPGLHRMRALCEALGNPQKNLKYVHLAGTNGKGSTATMIASVLQEAGYRTGLYTSPYLITFHERIRVNGKMIDDASLNRLTEEVEQAVSRLSLPQGEHIGEFEFVTAVSFLYFYEQQCDIVVLETGLGGEFDATNVIDAPEVAVITSVSLDHTAVLGETVEEIAETKAGILKKGSAAVCSCHQTASVQEILRKHAPGLIVASPPEKIDYCNLEGASFWWKGKQCRIRLVGAHQIENGCTALQAILALRDRGWRLTEEHISAGLSKAFIPARMQIVSEKPLILVDGAHNSGGVKVIASTMKEFANCKGIRLVIGMVADKDVKGCASILCRPAKRVYVTQPPGERALPCHQLANLLPEGAPICGVYEACEEAFAEAHAACGETDVLLISGSLYLAGEALRFFDERQKAAK